MPTHTLAGNCPPWNDEISHKDQPRYDAAAGLCYAIIGNIAKRRILALSDIRTLHRELFSEFVPIDYYAGNFRQRHARMPCLMQDVYIDDIHGNRLSGESCVSVERVMLQYSEQLQVHVKNLEIRWTTLRADEQAIELAIILGWIIGVFIKIHPFLNGNGRLSRFIWTWGLLRYGVSPQCRIAPRPDPPYDFVMEQAMKGDFNPLSYMILRHLESNAPTIEKTSK